MAARVMLVFAVLLGSLTRASARHLSPTIQRVDLAHATSVAPPAYEWAARAAHVPASVLFAVAREESGTRLRGRWIPWPWTLNVAGLPRRFMTRQEACAALRQALEHVSPHRIDVGLGQIDVGYFGHRVATPCELLNPYRNLLLAATILRRYHDAGDDWMVAIGRYHRPAGGAPAARYRHEVAEQLARVLANAGASNSPGTALP